MTHYKFGKFLIMLVVFIYLLAGAYSLASNTRTITIKGGGAVSQETTKQALQETVVGVSNSPTIDPVNYTGIPYMSKNVIYGYNSEKCQTDDTPNITASGQKTRDRIIANNCLAFGTKVKIDNKTKITRLKFIPKKDSKNYSSVIEDISFNDLKNNNRVEVLASTNIKGLKSFVAKSIQIIPKSIQ